MKWNRCVLFTILALIAGIISPLGPHVKADPDATSPVKIRKAVARGTAAAPIFDVEVSYHFDGKSTVWLQGIGEVPGSGEIAFTVRTSRVIFLDHKAGHELSSTLVNETEVHQTPPNSEPYPSSTIAAGWSADGQALVSPISVTKAWTYLDKTLQNVYGIPMGSTPCRPDDHGCLLTQWMSITPATAWTQAQVAIMITYDGVATPRGPGTSVKVYHLLRQAPIGEGKTWDYTIDQPIRDLALGKISQLQSQLKTR